MWALRGGSLSKPDFLIPRLACQLVKGVVAFIHMLRAKTRRTHGQSLPVIITDLHRTLKSWFEYFKHSHYPTFADLDAGCGSDCAASSANVGAVAAVDEVGTMSNGHRLSLPGRSCTVFG